MAEDKKINSAEPDENEQEEVLGKAYDARLMKRLIRYLKPYMKWVIIAIILTVGVALLSTVRPYLTKIAIDNYIVNKDSTGLRNIILILLVHLFSRDCFSIV